MVKKHPDAWQNVRLGVSTNFNKLCGMEMCQAAEVANPRLYDAGAVKRLYESVDFIGLSAYPRYKVRRGRGRGGGQGGVKREEEGGRGGERQGEQGGGQVGRAGRGGGGRRRAGEGGRDKVSRGGGQVGRAGRGGGGRRRAGDTR